MKRILCVFLSMILSVSLLAGCSSGGNSNESAPSGSSSAPDRTISGKLASFSAKTLDGKGYSPEDFKGNRLTVMNIWATYCGPCIGEMSELAEFKESLPSGIELITLCTDAKGNEKKARSLLDEHGLSATVITSADGDFAGLLGQIMYVPTTIFIAPDGSIVGSEIIGSPSDLAAEYNEHIDQALEEIGA